MSPQIRLLAGDKWGTVLLWLTSIATGLVWHNMLVERRLHFGTSLLKTEPYSIVDNLDASLIGNDHLHNEGAFELLPWSTGDKRKGANVCKPYNSSDCEQLHVSFKFCSPGLVDHRVRKITASCRGWRTCLLWSKCCCWGRRGSRRLSFSRWVAARISLWSVLRGLAIPISLVAKVVAFFHVCWRFLYSLFLSLFLVQREIITAGNNNVVMSGISWSHCSSQWVTKTGTSQSLVVLSRPAQNQ